MGEIVFLIQCPDKKGLLTNISNFFYGLGFNILHCQQHSDMEVSQYFMRIVLDMATLNISKAELEGKFSDFALKNNLSWTVKYSDAVPRLAVLVSKTSHCLYELLLAQQENELFCEIPLIISNHPELEYVAEQFRIPFYCFPLNRKNRKEQEKDILSKLRQHHIDLVVLARYMQILSADFISRYVNQIINIHHAFLPAFQGSNPYRQAFERGVKMIGATAHYATEDLDRGPIIEQDVERVSHENTIKELKQIGKDIERRVLVKAVKADLENRIAVFRNRTVVF